MDVSKAIKKGRDAAFTFYGSFLGLFVISFLLFSLIDADARDAFREMNEVFQHIFYSFLVLVFSCYVLGGLMGRYYYYRSLESCFGRYRICLFVLFSRSSLPER